MPISFGSGLVPSVYIHNVIPIKTQNARLQTHTTSRCITVISQYHFPMLIMASIRKIVCFFES
ncbi:MAG: hypothetical protein J5556_04880 [Deltaproteobacteria bacterium]|nr:hypothetical protein [Deltaproteobacteria bacterium]